MGKHLKGKVALVTTSASGIGRATVIWFLEEGAGVTAADLNYAGCIGQISLAHGPWEAYQFLLQRSIVLET